MVELRDALSQIAEIRQQMARGQIFRGYRSATTAFSGAAALAAGALQAALLPEPAKHPLQFVMLWLTAAAVCVIVVAAEMVLRTKRLNSQLQRQLTMLAVEQFVPSLVAGALVTWVFCDFLVAQAWMLPGLWMIVFALGVFASSRLLPRWVFPVAGFYMIAGVFALVTGSREWAFSPWLMGGTFAAGQFAIAWILYVKLERPRE